MTFAGTSFEGTTVTTMPPKGRLGALKITQHHKGRHLYDRC
jgi:hypothetical protein